MKILATLGDEVVALGYCYSNLNGGTEIVDNVRIRAKITKAWHDYETGWRYHATPINRDIKAQGKSMENRIFIGEFQIMEINGMEA